MKLLFIRHSIALEREDWDRDDLLRPLSKKGVKNANEFFSDIAKIYNIDTIVTSQAKRALETAKILHKYYPKIELIEDDKLNPSSNFENFIKVKDKIEAKFDKIEVIAFVGHEPDFSEIISKLISSSMVDLKLKKPSIVEIEFNENRGKLMAFLTPKHLKKLKV